MQCVNTLSWSVMGLGASAGPARRNMESLVFGARRAPAARDAQSGVTNHLKKEDPPVEASKLKSLVGSAEAAHPNKLGSHVGDPGSLRTPAVSPATCQPRTEVRPLEVDWSLIVRRCMDGDSGAWAEMVRTHHKRVYGLCYRFTGNVADAEDLTQDVFLKIYSNLASFDTARGSLQVWITTMTRNLLVDNFRRTKNQRATGSLDEGWEAVEELKPIDRLTSKGPSQHEQAAQKELSVMVQSALARVSVELREAVILRDLQDMDYKEIAQVLGIPEGTVKSRISRGRAELARLLERNKREVM
jgi:RNA polymerase sigma-70 factor (ECF subfamily)